MFWPQIISFRNNIMLRIPADKGGLGNPSAPIDVNMFHTTNFRSSSAMHVAEFHGNSHRDSTTHILSIAEIDIIIINEHTCGVRNGTAATSRTVNC